MSYAAVSENANAAAPRMIIIDMRCLQDPGQSERGIAAHARNAVARARAVFSTLRGARMIGLTDRQGAPLPADLAALADEIMHYAYLPELPPGTVFLQLSPMAEDQIFIARLLLSRNVVTVALLYDFIPFDEQLRYLRDPRQRLEYFTAMAWLKHYDLYLPISADAERRLQDLYPRARGRSVVTGVPLPVWEVPADAGVAGGARHVLLIGGDDPRKNPFVLVRAHARSQSLQRQKIPLIIAGNYGAADARALQALAVECGGAAGLVQVPGKVAAPVLHEFYRNALCVVTASRAEGFSMPVIEAMAAGVPSVVSDIPVHAALVQDTALRFGPDDDAALTAILERICGDPAYRAAIIAAQAHIWPQFEARAVAGRIWSAVENLVSLPRVNLPRRPRVAMLTPLPPTPSGIAIHSEALAKELGQRVDLTLFATDHESGTALVSGVPYLAARFDRVISVIGNSSEHHGIYDLAVRYGSACICHDARLLGLITTRFGMAWAARMASEELGRFVSQDQLHEWARDEQAREADFLGQLAAASRPLIFHTKQSVREVKTRFGKDAVFLPFAVYLPFQGTFDEAARRQAREKLGLARDEKLICSFGSIAAVKGVEPGLQALALLRRSGVACRLLWIGEGTLEQPRFEALAARLGVRGQAYFSEDYVSPETYNDYLLAADVGLQLRAARPGSISGALQDCIAAGLPSVANEDLAENLAAPDYVTRVSDLLAPAEIAQALARILQEARPRGFYEAARAAYCETYSMANYAESLCAALDLSASS